MGMTVAEVESRSIDRFMSKTGRDREETIKYFTLALVGAHGPVSKAGCDYCRMVLNAMTYGSHR